MPIKVNVIIERVDGEQCVQWNRIWAGKGELDPKAHLTPEGWIFPQLPDLLRSVAEQLESAMTTGPDEKTWLG